MKTRTLIKISIIGLVIFSIFSCTGDFEEINTNPNNPATAPAGNVLAYVIQNIASLYGTTEMEYPAAFVGHVTKGQYTDVTNYSGSVPTSIWTNVYTLTRLNSDYVIAEARKEGNLHMEAAAMILKVYGMQLVVDVYGKAPYFESGKLKEGIIHPAYDSEEVIYEEMMMKLDTANSYLAETSQTWYFGNIDLLYGDQGGDYINYWRKFCNSLHLRLAIRISNVDPVTASTEISKILNDPETYPVFEGNEDNAFVAYTGEGDWIEPWTSRHNSIGDDKIAKPITDALLNYNDPRLPFYADTIAGGIYVGLTVGERYSGKELYSNVGTLFVGNPAGSVYLMKYAEVEFIKAEAAARGLISGDAKAAYESGIIASCSEYEIDQAVIETYLEEPDVAWANDVNQIYVQKWIALFRQSWEAWAEMRRTDVPALDPAAGTSLSGHNRPPFRFPYPESEINLNTINIPADVVEEDNYWGYQIWWDTREGVN